MNMRLQTREKAAPTPSVAPARSGLLRRKCACGSTPGHDGECAECRGKQLVWPRNRTNRTDPSEVPPIVHEVLSASGEPLDLETRAFMEPRFGHDFSQVRVHSDARAAESARAVNALAYTSGKDIVFREEQYAPGTPLGQHLLAHELTHVVQQEKGNATSLDTDSVGSLDDAAESEAENIAAYLASEGKSPPKVRSKPTGVIQRVAPAVVGAAGALEAAGVALSGVSVVQDRLASTQGGLSYSSDQITYPRDLERVGATKPVNRTVATFTSIGMFTDNETEFSLHGDFSDSYETATTSNRTMANVYIEIENTTTYSQSLLTFSARALATPYGTPQDPKIRFVCTGRFDPAGSGDCSYYVVLEINQHGHAHAVEGRITSGTGDLNLYGMSGFTLWI